MTERPGAGPVSRRRLLTGGAVAVGGAFAGGGAVAAGMADDRPAATVVAGPETGTATEAFHGPRQAGIATHPQAHASFVAFNLRPETDRAALVRLMRLLSDDAARLSQGQPALGDTERELALLPARLTITFGFGPGLFRAAGLDDRRPASLADLPPFPVDRLEPAWSGGDLLVQICADDPLTVAHAQRMVVKDTRPFGTVRWTQQGFRRGPGIEDRSRTSRNVLGQLDGTANPKPGTAAFEQAVWVPDGPPWLRDSSTVVVRRIRAELETWDQLGRADKELAIGRRLDTGAPLTGRVEEDLPDFAATDELGFTVIPDFAHISLAQVPDDRSKIFRRPYNYDGVPDGVGRADSGLIFASYQADVARQFVPIQRRLAERDLFNEWITPIGSAVFAVPPGCAPDGWVGEQLLG